MKILNFGSVNIDRVYRVPHFVRPGETLSSSGFSLFAGGKGFNQSTALARAGAVVFHAGAIGADGLWLKEALEKDGADVHLLRETGSQTGHAIIQVDDNGQNCIIIEGGANQEIHPLDVDAAFAGFSRGDTLLIQNEISSIPEMIEKAVSKGMDVVFNPAPMSPRVLEYPLEKVSLFIVNEVEGAEIAQVASDDPAVILDAMQAKFPLADIVLTLGSKGAVARFKSKPELFVAAKKVVALDTTAAGDTFIGYFLAERQSGASLRSAMEVATAASAVCVTRMGAAPSIPARPDLVL